jgi:hypothetical protein
VMAAHAFIGKTDQAHPTLRLDFAFFVLTVLLCKQRCVKGRPMQTYDLLDKVQLSAIEREHAKAHMRSAELTIDFVFMAAAKVRLAIAGIARFVINLTHRIQISNHQAAR